MLVLTAAPETGTIVPEMGAAVQPDAVGACLFGKTRRAVLGLLFGHPDETFHLRQIARHVNLGMGTVQRELEALAGAGIVLKSRAGNMVHYRVNRELPVYGELRSIVEKTAGAADVVRAALAGLSGRIALAFVYGSVASGAANANSDLDLMIIGDVALAEAVVAIQPAQKALGREVNPSVFTADEFRSKARSGNHFVRDVVSSPKIFVIGGQRELERLGRKRLASGTQGHT